MTGLTEAVAAVVERHHLPFVPHAGQVRCMCGEWTGFGNQHAAHVAAAVESVVAAGRAEDRARLAAVEGLLAAYGEESADEFLVYQLRAALAPTVAHDPTP